MYRRVIKATILAFTIGLCTAGTASACPLCKEANGTDDRRPQAYMYSILFMLAVPPTLLTAFGVGFYRLSKQADEVDMTQFGGEPSTSDGE